MRDEEFEAVVGFKLRRIPSEKTSTHCSIEGSISGMDIDLFEESKGYFKDYDTVVVGNSASIENGDGFYGCVIRVLLDTDSTRDTIFLASAYTSTKTCAKVRPAVEAAINSLPPA